MELGGEWLLWRHNHLTASIVGGVWKQHVRSTRGTLAALLKEYGKTLND